MRPIAVGSGGALLEREQELQALDEAIEGLDAGDGAVVLLEGVAGAGKSRLLDAARESAAESGVRVLSARCSELETGFSFGVVLQLFEPALAGMTRDERNRALSGSAQSAAWLFDAVEGTPVGASGDALFRTLHGLYWLTAALASGRPLSILVDDAHWCDEATFRFPGYLARRLEGLPVALIVALRGDDGHRRLATLSELSSNLRSQRLRPSPLSADAVELLVRERVSSDAEPGFCSRCAEITGGNPFLVHELLSEIKREGLPADAAGAKRVGGLVPESVVRAVIARIAGLPEGSAQLVRAAAVLGESATLRRCTLLAGIAPEAADRAV